MKQLTFYIILCCLLFSSCRNENENNNASTIIISKEKEVNISDFVSEMKMIRLENSDTCVLAPIKKIEIHRNKIYISDIVFKGIYVFNPEGNLERKLSKEGRGNGEYISIDDFIIDEETNSIEVFDGTEKMIYVYELESFKFIKAIKIPISFGFSFTKAGNYYYFQTNDARNQINDQFTNSEIICFNSKTASTIPLFNRHLPENENQSWEFYNVFTKDSDNRVYVSLAWHDDIYELENKTIRPIIHINKGSRGIPSEIQNGSYQDKMNYLESGAMDKKIHFFKLMMKNKQGTIVAYGKGYPPKICHYLDIKGYEKSICTDNIINDIIPVVQENLEIFKVEDGNLLSVFYPFNENEDSHLLKYFSATESDNPILLMFKLKNTG